MNSEIRALLSDVYTDPLVYIAMAVAVAVMFISGSYWLGIGVLALSSWLYMSAPPDALESGK